MTQYHIWADLCESRLIPSRTSLKHWETPELRKLAYLYFLGLRVLVSDADTQEWAKHYLSRTIKSDDFTEWRNDANDFYVFLYALCNEDDDSSGGVASKPIRDWMRHTGHREFNTSTQRLFNRLDAMFRVTDSDWKAMRRNVAHWNEVDERSRAEIINKLYTDIKKLAPNSEIIAKLKALSKSENQDDIAESASAGATGAASVATAVGGLGAGFDVDGDWGIYQFAKPKAKKAPVIIRR